MAKRYLFDRNTWFWSRVFKQVAGSPEPAAPNEIVDVVQPVVDFHGSNLYTKRSLWTVTGAVSTAVVKMATPIPIDEVWWITGAEVQCDDAISQWAYATDWWNDGSSLIHVSAQIAGLSGDTWKQLLAEGTKLFLPGGHYFGIDCNMPTAGKRYKFRFSYVPLKAGEYLLPF